LRAQSRDRGARKRGEERKVGLRGILPVNYGGGGETGIKRKIPCWKQSQGGPKKGFQVERSRGVKKKSVQKKGGIKGKQGKQPSPRPRKL